jgi:hypothetical protein
VSFSFRSARLGLVGGLGGMGRGFLKGMSFLDLGNVLVKWDSDFFTLQKGFLG